VQVASFADIENVLVLQCRVQHILGSSLTNGAIARAMNASSPDQPRIKISFLSRFENTKRVLSEKFVKAGKKKRNLRSIDCTTPDRLDPSYVVLIVVLI